MSRRLGDRRAGVAVTAILLAAACRQMARVQPRPSIIVITIDTLRADHVTPQLMPTLDALSQESVVFEQAVTVAPLTLPAHASLFTGLYPPRHRIRDNQMYALPADVVTYPLRLKSRGYATGAFVSAVVLDHRFGLVRGFDTYDDEIDGPERPGRDTIARAERWIDSAGRPFFLWLHLFEPHAPYRTGSYAGEVKEVDAALADFFGYLQRTQIWDRVIVSVTADHGESLGEHGEQTHGFFLYDATLRIPWILKVPDFGGRRVRQLVRIIDEIPTILDIAELGDRNDDATAADGVSVAALARGGRSLGLEAYSETFLPRDQFGWSSLTSIRTDRLKFIEAPQPELYDLASDPGELTNVITLRKPDARRLERVLFAIARAPSPSSARIGADPLLAEKLLSLGYIGYASGAVNEAGVSLADPKAKVDVYNLTMTALELSEKGDFTAALTALRTAERRDPHVAQIEFLKGTLLGQIGQYDQAAAALEQTLALSPHHTGARFKLALAWLRMGRADRAAEALREVVREQPDDFRAWHNLATIAYSRGDLDEAETLEHRALELFRNYAEAWNTLGAIALVRKTPTMAVEALTKATELAPQNAQAFKNLSLALRAVGQSARAQAAADRACVLDRRLCSTTGGQP
jgi:Flp pilus assembly protein TadD